MAPNLFEALFDAAVEAVVVIDEQGEIQAVNQAVERLFLYPEDELLGRNVRVLMPEPMSSEHDGYLRRYLETSEPKIIGRGREVVARRRDGSLFPADLAVGEGASEDGRFFVGILRDLTERKALQESLRRREEELAVMIEHSPVATAVLSLEGEMLEVNSACEQLSGVPRAEILGLRVDAMLADPAPHAVFDALEAAARGNSASLSAACQGSHEEPRLGTLHLTPLPRERDDRGQILLHFIDETDRIQAEAQISRSRETLSQVSRLSILGEMAAGIAHEVNQPLGAISNYAEAARLMFGDADPKADSILAKIGEQARRAGAVIDRLRNVAAGRQGAASTHDPNEVAHSVLQLAALDARFVDVTLEEELAEPLPNVVVDEISLQQILLNLLRNAVEATAENGGGRVVLRSRRAGDRVHLEVSDEGSGVAPENASLIMSPFFTTKSTGMGVGLALCQRLAEADGGRIRFQNNEPGPGATFWVELPARIPERELETSERP